MIEKDGLVEMKAIDLITQLKEEHAVLQNLIGFLFGMNKNNKTQLNSDSQE